MNQRELKQSIQEDQTLTNYEKAQKLNALRAPYVAMSDEELLQLVRDFARENGREPAQADVLYDRELKARFGPWPRMLKRAGTRPVGKHYLEKKEKRKAKRAQQREYRRQIREQQASEAQQAEETVQAAAAE